MLLLTTNTDKLRLVTSAAATIDVHVSAQDKDQSTGALSDYRLNTAITTATTTDIAAVPASGFTRNIKTIHVRNKHASLACDVTVVYQMTGPVDYELFKATLFAGDHLEYIEGVGFFVVANNLSSPGITSAELSSQQKVLTSSLPPAAVGTFVTISGTAYYLYLGRVVRSITIDFVEIHVTTAGAGAQTAEIGLFSTPTPPQKSAQTLTKIVATGTVDAVTPTGVKRNTASFAQVIAAGTHLWAGVRFAMATTQPTCAGRAGDMSQGHVLTTTGGGALTGLSTAAGTIPAIATATVAPDLRGIVA